jgi:hypothetical protein
VPIRRVRNAKREGEQMTSPSVQAAPEYWADPPDVELCGECEWCHDARPRFEGILDGIDGDRARLQEPERFAYTSRGLYLHRTTCRKVQAVISRQPARPEGGEYLRLLTKWAHEHHDYHSPDGWERYDGYEDVEVMSMERAQRWADDLRGPQGGRNYTTCKICRPVPIDSNT